MKAIILVAGYATRLYPLTLNTPKALLHINGKAIIDYIADEINTLESVDEIYVVSNDKFYNHFKHWASQKDGKRISVLNDGTTNEENRRGAIGDIYFTIQEKNIDDDVIIIAGDNFFTFSLNDYYEFFLKENKDCVCAKEMADQVQIKQFAVALLDENHKIIDLEEKPEEPKSSIAVYASYIYKRDTLPLFKTYLQEGNKPDAPGYFVQWLYQRKDVYAYLMDGDCYDIGTEKSYNAVKKQFE